MIVDLEVLSKKFKTDKRAIKTLFTAEAGSELHEKRKEWQNRIESRIHAGTIWGLENYQFAWAADLAWDSNIISKEIIPLTLYAQGKIKAREVEEQLKEISADARAQFVTKNEQGELEVNIPEFHKVVVSLCRSLLTKRVGSLAARYAKLQPLFDYEPYGTSYVASLKGEVLSQRVEMISNAYGYRHDLVQAIREVLMYSHVLEFPCNVWDKQKGVRKKVRSEAADTSDTSEFEVESYVAREGIIYKRPHPTRTFWDMAHPLASINNDTGVTYLGHWTMVPFRDVGHNPCYFNRERIEFDTSFATKLVGYKNYWSIYASNSPINFPNYAQDSDIGAHNDRERMAGVYTTGGTDHKSTKTDGDTSVLLTEYFEKVVPNEVGLGTYPHPVWVRLVVAADHTVVYGEIIPYTPATYWSYNCADNKILNNSFVHDAMPWQDQLSNMFSAMRARQLSSLVKLITLDIDQIPNEDLLKKIRKIVGGEELFAKPLLIERKGVQDAEMGRDPREMVSIAETTALGDPTADLRAIMMVFSLAERVLGTSSNESAQSEQRTVSATETATIADSVNNSLGFMGQGIDEAVAAKKRQLYEALIACAESRVKVPVAGRYLDKTIKAAGFEVVSEEDEATKLENYADEEPHRVTVLGDKFALEYDYSFTGRDGSERPVNAKAAEILVQLLQPLSQSGVLEKAGADQLYGLINAILRLSGAGVDFQFEPKEGDNDALPGDPKEELDAIVQQLIGALEEQKARMDQAGIPPIQQAQPTAAPPM